MDQEMPLGFGFALGENEKALSVFAGMTEDERKQVMEAARCVQSKHEMRDLVDQLTRLEG